MKKFMIVAALAACASGCVGIGSPAQSILVLNVNSSAPFVDNAVKPVKQGTSTASGIICFVEGDCSIKAAMANGGITKVHHIDYTSKNILGIVGTLTTTVYGE